MGSEMSGDRITYVGHATVLIEIGGMRLLTDPVLRPLLLGIIRRHGPDPAPEVAREIDAVLISHLHHDHLDFPSLRRVGRKVPVFVPAGAGKLIRRRGFANVVELAPGGSERVGTVEVTATRAVHDGRRYKLGRATAAAGYLLAAADRRVYFAGDTDLFPGMAALGRDLDAALLPIAGWGTSVGPGHLDPRRAAEAAAMLRPRIAIPIHWGTLLRRDLARRRPELLELPGRRFVAQLARRAPAVEAAVLSPGESLELSPARSPASPRSR